MQVCKLGDIEFLSTPSARRATALKEAQGELHNIFLSTPSARRATVTATETSAMGVISIHALREEGDNVFLRRDIPSKISIHALREEGDARRRMPPRCPLYFYPRPPRGGRRRPTSQRSLPAHFYPRPPRGGRPPRF